MFKPRCPCCKVRVDGFIKCEGEATRLGLNEDAYKCPACGAGLKTNWLSIFAAAILLFVLSIVAKRYIGPVAGHIAVGLWPVAAVALGYFFKSPKV
ncbi:MAG TPA: hypothetical protein VFW42_01860 [Fluviicoccus sp.]|nr:hypothetical protein [Fluviicoccus sp.]